MGFPLGTRIDAQRGAHAEPGVDGRHGAVSVCAPAGATNGVLNDELTGAALGFRAARPRFARERWARWIAVAGGCGYSPVAPGTMGSLLAVLMFVGAVGFASASSASIASFEIGYAVAVLVLFLIGVWASGHAEVAFGRHDDGRIVIDEVVGQAIALAPLLGLSLGAFEAGSVSPSHFIPFFLWVVTGFVLFRLFDVWKPGVIRWTERRLGGGLGVMADDVMAGIHAAIVLLMAQAIVPTAAYASLASLASLASPESLQTLGSDLSARVTSLNCVGAVLI